MILMPDGSPQATSHRLHVVHHERFERSLSELMEGVRICRALGGGIIPFLGPTRCGKSEVIQLLKKRLQKSAKNRNDFFHDSTVILASIPESPNITSVRQTILKALDPRTFSTSLKGESLRSRMLRALERKSVEVIILDECSHCTENDSQFGKRAAADLFKSISDACGATLVLAGLPKFQSTIDANEQLRDRSYSTVRLQPYVWTDIDDQSDFTASVLAAFDQLRGSGFEIQFDELDMSARLYGVSGGRVGMMIRVLEFAAIGSKAKALDFDQVKLAASRAVQAQLEPKRNFNPDPPAVDMLVQSYARVMQEAGLEIEINTGSDFAAVYG